MVVSAERIGDDRVEAALPNGSSSQPIFVLCTARSGSTLLRLLLDSHPEIFAPPETNLAAVCGTTNFTGRILNDEQAAFSEMGLELARNLVESLMRPRVSELNKTRWCDKSLLNADSAELLHTVWPEAQFICLHRHCMDVVNSALEANPWGLGGYGFAPYAISSPANSVTALVRYWIDKTTSILRFEEAHADRCHRLYYEELVTAPDQVLGKLCEFLQVAPGALTFDPASKGGYDQRWPGDHKIWYTNSVRSESIGTGLRIPRSVVHPSLLDHLNGLLDKLGYRCVDERWGRDDSLPPTAGDAVLGESDNQHPPSDANGKARILKIVMLTPGEQEADVWYVDLDDEPPNIVDIDEESVPPDVVLIGHDSTIKALAAGSDNFGAALRQRTIRMLMRSKEGKTVDVGFDSCEGEEALTVRIASILSTELAAIVRAG